MRFSPPLGSPAANLTPTSLVLSVLRDRSGTVWAGTFGRGLFRIQRRQGGADCRNRGRGLADVPALFLDSRQTLWMGYQRRVASYSEGRLTRLRQMSPERLK